MKKKIKFLSLIFCCIALCFAFTGCSISEIFGGGYKSAYQIAVDNGYTGTEEEWLKSFNAQNISLYDDAVARGTFDGTFEEFLIYMANLSSANNWTAAANTSMRSSVKITAFNTGESSGSTGSGTIIYYNTETCEAHVLTCYHVIVDTAKFTTNYCKDIVKIYFYGTEDDSDSALTASFLGGTVWNDVAFLKVTIPSNIWSNYNLRVAQISSAEPALQEVDAIGNSKGKGINVAHCNISKQYDLSSVQNINGSNGLTTLPVMRVNAVLQQGNSGGGLFDINSKVVGMIGSKASLELKVQDSAGNVTGNDEYNFSYAIPSSTILAIYNNVMSQIGGLVTWAMAKKYQLDFNLATLIGGEHRIEVVNGLVYPTADVVLEASSGEIEQNVDVIRTAKIIRSGEEIASVIVRNEYTLSGFMWYAQPGDTVVIGYKDNDTSTIKTKEYNITVADIISSSDWYSSNSTIKTYSKDPTRC